MPSGESKKIQRVVISEQIKEQLIEDIFHHRYKSGDKLVESALSRELGVSQTSVREALRSLVAMGFLESEPYKGITVRSLSKQDLMEVSVVRSTLEALAASIAIERITDQEIEELEQILKEMIEASKAGKIPERIRLNLDFHQLLIRLSGNKLIMKLYKNLQFESWSMMTGALSTMEPVALVSRHWKLMDAIKSRDSEKVKIAMKQHIEESSKQVFDTYQEEE